MGYVSAKLPVTYWERKQAKETEARLKVSAKQIARKCRDYRQVAVFDKDDAYGVALMAMSKEGVKGKGAKYEQKAANWAISDAQKLFERDAEQKRRSKTFRITVEDREWKDVPAIEAVDSHDLMRDILRPLLSRIPDPATREILDLTIVDGLSGEAIAEKLQLSTGYVSTKKRKGLTLLRKLVNSDTHLRHLCP